MEQISIFFNYALLIVARDSGVLFDYLFSRLTIQITRFLAVLDYETELLGSLIQLFDVGINYNTSYRPNYYTISLRTLVLITFIMYS